MSDVLHCCPRCSVMPPAGVVFTPAAHSGAFRSPLVWTGRRSGKFWFHRTTGCQHQPQLAGVFDEAAAISLPWNTWAKAEALVVADERLIAGERRRWWLYWLGVTALPV